MGNFDNVLNRNFIRSLPNSSSSDGSRTAISAVGEIAERLNVLQHLGDKEQLDTQRRQIEPAFGAQLRKIEQGRIKYAERRLQNSNSSQCQKLTASQQQARQQLAAQRPLGPSRVQRLPVLVPEALGQAAQPHNPPASSVSYQGRSAQQLKLCRPIIGAQQAQTSLRSPRQSHCQHCQHCQHHQQQTRSRQQHSWQQRQRTLRASPQSAHPVY